MRTTAVLLRWSAAALSDARCWKRVSSGAAASAAIFSAAVIARAGGLVGELDGELAGAGAAVVAAVAAAVAAVFIIGIAPARSSACLYFSAVAASQSRLINWALPLNSLSSVAWSALKILASLSRTTRASKPAITWPAK
ncbi:MAG: hypothetical protein IPG06_16235 [Haliea sp.]|nr:hypothetical protein [Haliea sp.]